MNEIKKLLSLFLQVFIPCMYGIITTASFIGVPVILVCTPIWAWLFLLVIIPLGIASGVRLYQLITPLI